MKTNQFRQLLSILSDGNFHTGEEIGNSLSITRSAVWKLLNQLAAFGINVQRVHAKGYRVLGGLQAFQPEAIQSHLDPHMLPLLTKLEVLEQVDSTNHYLRSQIREQSVSGHVCLAEYQTAGRGRNHRSWYSPYGKNIYLSILWRFEAGAGQLSGLSLAVGVMICQALSTLGLNQAQLKWPNDVYYHNKKLAGVLIETYIDSLGVCHAVIGIGVNLALSQAVAAENIDQPWVDILMLSDTMPDKNKVTAALLNALLLGLTQFEQQGFMPFVHDWQQRDHLYGKWLTLKQGEQIFSGKACGIDECGGLLLQTEQQLKTCYTGDITVIKQHEVIT